MKLNKTKNMTVVANQQGYSMLELLVAMTIGVLVLSSAVSMQVSNRDGFKSTTTQLNMKTNAKLAAEFIGTSLRGVGVMGCRTTEGYMGGADRQGQSAYNNGLRTQTLEFADFNSGHEVFGYQASGNSWVPVPSADLNLVNMVPGSDALTLRGGVGESYVLLDRDSATDNAYRLDIAAGTNVQIRQNNYAVASTCMRADVFHVTSTDEEIDNGIIGRLAGPNADDNESGTVGDGGLDKKGYGELRRMATVTYYVGDSPAGVPTLYRNIDGISSPLVEGVERMKLDYGLENQNGLLRNVASRYLSASDISATCTIPLAQNIGKNCLWQYVVSVRVSLIMRSKETVFGKDIVKTYTLPGTDELNYDVNDKYARAIYSSTFVLRNRMIGDRTDNG